MAGSKGCVHVADSLLAGRSGEKIEAVDLDLLEESRDVEKAAVDGLDTALN